MIGRALCLFTWVKSSVIVSVKQGCRRHASQKTLSEKYRSLFYPAFPQAPYDFVCQIGDPILRQKCDKVDESVINTARFQSLISQMWQVHKEYECAGLSAPQIGLPLQVAVIGFSEEQCKESKSKFYTPIPYRVMINPVMKILNYRSKITALEGCASMCSFNAQVSRYTDIRIEALNEKGAKSSWEAYGFEARVIQHEMDHLDGTIYVDIMEPKTLECSVWQNVNAHKGKGYIRFGPQKENMLNRIKLSLAGVK